MTNKNSLVTHPCLPLFEVQKGLWITWGVYCWKEGFFAISLLSRPFKVFQFSALKIPCYAWSWIWIAQLYTRWLIRFQWRLVFETGKTGNNKIHFQFYLYLFFFWCRSYLIFRKFEILAFVIQTLNFFCFQHEYFVLTVTPSPRKINKIRLETGSSPHPGHIRSDKKKCDVIWLWQKTLELTVRFSSSRTAKITENLPYERFILNSFIPKMIHDQAIAVKCF